MIDIQIAGAGAGKTFGLASEVINELKALGDSHKKIYALTYTNSAVEKIQIEISNKCGGNLPNQIEVQTLHSFLLHEIIYPFSPFVVSEAFRSSSTVKLSANYKAYEIRRLKDIGLIHVEDVYAAARRCVDRDMSMHNSRAKKAKVDRVLQILSACIKKVFIDEAQDLDGTALRVIEVLGLAVADVYLVGDPKQAIKYPRAFSDFIESCRLRDGGTVNFLPIINSTQRVPTEILNVSNQFCPDDQAQNSVSEVTGSLKYIESTHPEFDDFLNIHLNCGSLVCIDQRQGNYSTNIASTSGCDPEITDMVLKGCVNRDPEIFVEAALIKFQRNVSMNGSAQAVRDFLQEHRIEYEASIYAKMMNMTSRQDDGTYNVSSIDSVKGLEANICVLILTPNTYKYLTKTDLEANQEFNKEWKKIYVVLTRAKLEFIVVLDHSLFETTDINIQQACAQLSEMGFARY